MKKGCYKTLEEREKEKENKKRMEIIKDRIKNRTIFNSNLKFKNGFNALLSESFSSLCDKKLLAIPFKSSVIWARESKDKASISQDFKYPYLFSFLLVIYYIIISIVL